MGSPVTGRTLADGVLADVTPTLLELAGVAPAPGMSGHSLLKG
jgi:bisphosphoglycerate-independent phosphoglycerate mutase (AlkP superfamily)